MINLKTIIKKVDPYLILISFLFLLLVFKDPFSTRTLIPNLEPYPDTFHYLNPPLSLLKGEGFKVVREGRGFLPAVAPLYSFLLIPVFLIKPDPRMFYFLNVLLSLGSIGILYLILRKAVSNLWIVRLVVFFYATNFFIYWYPTIPMAETLVIFIYLLAVYLLLCKVSIRNAFFAGFISVSFYATKYASITLMGFYFMIYFLKILFSQKQSKSLVKYLSVLIGSFGLFFIAYYLFEDLYKGNKILGGIIVTLLEYFPAFKPTYHAVTGQNSSASFDWFSSKYIPTNLPLYLKAMMGQPMRFLWDFTPIVPTLVGLSGLTGLIIGFFNKNLRLLSIYLVALLFPSILFISTFYSADARFIFEAIPTLIIGFGIFLYGIFLLFEKKKLSKKMFYAFLVGILALYSVTNALRFKSQIMLNLRHAEVPWYYVSVLKLNDYMGKDKIENGHKPVVISSLPPYLVDFYSNGNYTLLPLSLSQEFQSRREIVWGNINFQDLPGVYTGYLKQGYPVYLSEYGLGNEKPLHDDFNKILSKFSNVKVYEGCYTQCDIYRLGLK